MNILVTGGAGFIGSHVSDFLLNREDEVIVVDNFNDYYNPLIKERNIAHNIKNPKFKIYNVDITDFESLKKVFEENKIDKVIHLAARAGVRPSIVDPFLYESVNIRGTLNLLELCREFGINVFILASSSSVYGDRTNVPFKETDNVDNPISPYAASKKAIELLGYTYHHLYKIKVSCLRFFTVYGPRGRPDMMPLIFTEKIAKDQELELYAEGKQKRDFTYIEDIVLGIVSALDHGYDYEIFNLGNSNPVETKYFLSLIEKELGKKAKIKTLPAQKGDVQLTYADITKAKELLGYNPKTRVEQGVKNMVDWYKQSQYIEKI